MSRFYVDVTQKDIDTAIREARKRAQERGGCPDCPIDYAVARMLPGGRSSDVNAGHDSLKWRGAEIGIPSSRAVRFMEQIDEIIDAIEEGDGAIPKPPEPCRLSFLVP